MAEFTPGAYGDTQLLEERYLDRIQADYEAADEDEGGAVEPGLLTRAMRDIGESIASGQILQAPFAGTAKMGIEFARLLGTPIIGPEGEGLSNDYDAALGEVKKTLTTGTAQIGMETTPYLINAIPGFAAGGAVANAAKLGPKMTGLFQLLGGATSDFATGALFENPDSGDDPATVLLSLIEMADDPERFDMLRTGLQTLAIEADDPEALKRGKRGAQEVLTELTAEALFLGGKAAKHLPQLFKGFEDGSLPRLAGQMKEYGSRWRELAHNITAHHPEMVDEVYGRPTTPIGHEIALMRGAERFANGINRLNAKLAGLAAEVEPN